MLLSLNELTDVKNHVARQLPDGTAAAGPEKSKLFPLRLTFASIHSSSFRMEVFLDYETYNFKRTFPFMIKLSVCVWGKMEHRWRNSTFLVEVEKVCVGV